MDLEKGNSTSRVFVHWGKAEKWIAGAVAALITGLIGTLIGVLSSFGQNVTDRLDTQNDKMQTVVTQQAVQSGQIGTLTTQLADVPRLTREMAEMKVRVDRHEQDIRELNRR